MSKKKAPELQLEGKNRTTSQQAEGSVMTKVSGADPGVNQGAVAESNVIEMPRRCEGKNHPTREYGHEGPAAWIVTAVCPACAWADVVLLCDGRVQWIIDRNGDFTCGSCAGTMHWSECWTLAPIGSAS